MRRPFGVRLVSSCLRCSVSTAANRGKDEGCVEPGQSRRDAGQHRFDRWHGAGRSGETRRPVPAEVQDFFAQIFRPDNTWPHLANCIDGVIGAEYLILKSDSTKR
jgi:hypothetical protein